MRDLRESKIHIPGEVEKARGKREELPPDFRPLPKTRAHEELVFGETFPSQKIRQEVPPVDGKGDLTGSKKVKVGIKDEEIRQHRGSSHKTGHYPSREGMVLTDEEERIGENPRGKTGRNPFPYKKWLPLKGIGDNAVSPHQAAQSKGKFKETLPFSQKNNRSRFHRTLLHHYIPHGV
jgi:hypothetical protein